MIYGNGLSEQPQFDCEGWVSSIYLKVGDGGYDFGLIRIERIIELDIFGKGGCHPITRY